jgi:hypothetical protein
MYEAGFARVKNRTCLSGYKRCREKLRSGRIDSSPVAGTTLSEENEELFATRKPIGRQLLAGAGLGRSVSNLGSAHQRQVNLAFAFR